MIPEEVQKNFFALKSCACDIAREALKLDPEYNIENPDINSEAHERMQIAKEIGIEWGCPNWIPAKIDYKGASLPEHKLEYLHSIIQEPKDKKHLAIIKGYENFIGIQEEQKGKCYKTCPKFYHSRNSPVFDVLNDILKQYRWFNKNQFSVVNPNPTQFDIDAIDALQDGNYLAEKYHSDKMQKENEKIKKQLKENSIKEKTIK